MEVQVTPDTARKLTALAETSGRAAEEIVEEALRSYLDELSAVREMLDTRYNDLASGRVTPIDGDEAFRRLRERSTARQRVEE